MKKNTDTASYIEGDIINVKGYDNNNNPTPVKCKVTIPGQYCIGIEILDKEIDSGKNVATILGEIGGDDGRKYGFIHISKIIKNLNSYFNDLKLNLLRPLDGPIIEEQN